MLFLTFIVLELGSLMDSDTLSTSGLLKGSILCITQLNYMINPDATNLDGFKGGLEKFMVDKTIGSLGLNHRQNPFNTRPKSNS